MLEAISLRQLELHCENSTLGLVICRIVVKEERLDREEQEL